MTTPPRRRGRPRQHGLAQQRREQIIEAAYAVFTEQGYRATTVSAIARHAGVGQGTVYRYFDSKIEILRAVFDWTAQRLLAAIDLEGLAAPIDSFDDLTERIATLATTLTGLVERDPRLLQLFVVEASSADPELQQRVVGLERMLAARLANTLSASIAAGRIRADINPEVYGHLLLSLAIPAFTDLYHGRLTPALRARHAAAIAELLERALQAGAQW